MKKVLLISANMMKQPYAVYPLGLDYVAGALQPDYEVRILDMNQKKIGLIWLGHLLIIFLRNILFVLPL